LTDEKEGLGKLIWDADYLNHQFWWIDKSVNRLDVFSRVALIAIDAE
jgi:hypothetical protein